MDKHGREQSHTFRKYASMIGSPLADAESFFLVVEVNGEYADIKAVSRLVSVTTPEDTPADKPKRGKKDE